jgi:glycosyltransferase involved in cell wall biosynthesis
MKKEFDMRGYYIHFDAKATPGVAKKIDMQIQEFSKTFDMQEIDIKAQQVGTLKRAARLLPGGYIQWDYTAAFRQVKKDASASDGTPDFVYIRKTTIDRGFVRFLATIKQKFPNCKVLIELFTYPYDKDEFARWSTWPYYLKDKYNRSRLGGLVDRFVTYSVDEEIFGIKTIRTMNGIDVAATRQVVPEAHRTDDAIHMIAVAFMQVHHGYERLIQGLADYYRQGGERNLVLHLVGDGPEKHSYEELVQRLQMQEHVKFYPSTQGEALDRLYDHADLAVSSLGCYKRGVNRLSALKTRECLAKGLPMVTGCDIDVLMDTDFPYYIQFPNDESSIDVDRVVKFYDETIAPQDRTEVIRTIREFAFRTVDMSVAMQPIVDYIKNEYNTL